MHVGKLPIYNFAILRSNSLLAGCEFPAQSAGITVQASPSHKEGGAGLYVRGGGAPHLIT